MCFRQIGGHAFRILAPGYSNLEKIARAIFSQARRPPTEASGKVTRQEANGFNAEAYRKSVADPFWLDRLVYR
jgi:hypothetical protein